MIAPNFISVRMFTARRRALPAPRRPRDQRNRVGALLDRGRPGESFDEHGLEEAIAYDWRIYAEDLPIVSAIEPPELPLDPNADVNTLADRFTLAYRHAFAEFVERALSEGQSAVFGNEPRLDLGHQLRLAVRVDVDRPGPGREVVVPRVA